MRVGIIQNKVEFKCTYDERERVFNIQIPEREVFEKLFDRTHSELVDVYLEISGDVDKAAEPTETQEVIEDMCSNYCKWPNEWNEEKQGTELCESDTCSNCPLNRL